MPDQDNVFGTNGATPPSETPPQSKDYAHLLGLIQNEKGEQKYATIEDALKGLAHAQAYIPQLKSELADREAKLADVGTKLTSQEELMKVVERLTAKQPEGTGQPPAAGLDEQAVAKILEQKLAQVELAKSAQSNAELVSQELIKRFGEKVKDVVAVKAAELGMTPEELGELAKSRPKAVLAYFPQAQAKPGVTTGSLNIPPIRTSPEELQVPKNLLWASDREKTDAMAKIREHVWAKYNVENPKG